MKRIRSYGPSLVLGVVTVAVLLGGPQVVRQLAWAQQESQVERSRQALEGNPLSQLSVAFREVAKAVEPSVVHISVSRRAESRSRMSPRGGQESPEDMLRRWFEERYGERDGQGDQDQNQDEGDQDAERYEEYNVPQPYGAGSGWVYQHADGDKYVITNNHVIQEADNITVKFFDQTERTAEVVGTDPQTDIAVLRIEGNRLHAAKVADNGIEQGDLVFAFGSPFQFEFSMSQGIVSGEGRSLGILQNVQGYENFIQTDAAINPGNSGGPLTNGQGEVIGMNTAIATRTGAYNGLGFAIPVNMIRQVVDQIIETGGVSRGYLGVWIRDLDPNLARSFGYEGQGVLVDDVVGQDSPAAAAGIQAGDIITEVNGRAVRDAAGLRRAIAAIRPNQTVDVEVFRNGERQTFEVELAEQPTDVATRGRGGGGTNGGGEEDSVSPDQLEPLRQLGMEELSTLTEQAADQLDVELRAGVLVEDVRAGSIAFSQGLRPGAIITEVQGEQVESLNDLVEKIAEHDLSEGVRLRIHIQGVNRFVFLQLP